MKDSAKRALENFKALEPAQQERVKQALVDALEMRALARAQVIQNRSDATTRSGGSATHQFKGY